MKKTIITTALMALTLFMNVQAQERIELDLWQEGLPNSNGIEKDGYDDEKLNFKPSITAHIIKDASAPTRCVVIYPGGGYHHLAMDHEGHDWAPYFRNLGIATVVLKYRMPHGHLEVPQSDAYEAIRQVKLHAREWNINPDDIGIMGFSAGGHLASTVATHASDDLLPAFQILIYPVITSDPEFTHQGSMDNLLGKNPSKQLLELYSNELQVTAKTPRAFLGLADDDKTVPPMNSTRYYSALKSAGVPSSLHIYPTGGHGFGIYESFKYHIELLQDLKSWLQSF